MGLWTVRGGNRLYGTVQVQGAKNGVLPILAACLVYRGTSVLERVPRVRDVDDILSLLRDFNCKVVREGHTVTIDSTDACFNGYAVGKVRHIRAGVLFLGAMAARFGEGRISVPQHSHMGPRPLDLHIAALTKLGAQIAFDEEEIVCRAAQLRGGEVVFPFPSVGATEHAMITACGCAGETILRNCAAEPEVEALGEYLNAMGSKVVGAGTDTIFIRPGIYHGTVHQTMIPDRIAASTLLCAVAACGGKINLQEVICTHLHPVLDVLGEMGCNIKIRENTLTLQSDGCLWSPSTEIVTGAYPGFPSDVQPSLLAASLKADGVTVLKERMLAGRLGYAKQLRRFGGNVALTEDCTAVVTGVTRLSGAYAETHELYGGAALIVAALQADGESRIVDAGKIARGYEFLDAVLRQLGADIDYSD